MMEPFGWLIFFMTLIFALFFYFKMKKWYVVSYLASMGLYVFTIIFAINAFELSKGWILILLLFSAGLMIHIGRKV